MTFHIGDIVTVSADSTQYVVEPSILPTSNYPIIVNHNSYTSDGRFLASEDCVLTLVKRHLDIM